MTVSSSYSSTQQFTVGADLRICSGEMNNYCKNPKNLDSRKNSCSHPKILTKWLCRRVMHPKDADRLANSVDPDQTAPLGAV